MQLQKWVYYLIATLFFTGLSLINWFHGQGDKSVWEFIIIAANLILLGFIISKSFKTGFIKKK